MHLSACKYILGVKSSTNTEGIYAELGRITIQLKRHINILKFLARLESLNDLEPNRYVCKSFRFLCNNDNLDGLNWVSEARDLRYRNGVIANDNASTIKAKVKNCFANSVMSSLNEHIIENKKLSTYAEFKSVFKFERYLDVICDFKRRQSLSKFRLSAHKLEIEVGRFGKNKIPRTERFCKYCITLGKNIIGDEIHFLMLCPLF